MVVSLSVLPTLVLQVDGLASLPALPGARWAPTVEKLGVEREAVRSTTGGMSAEGTKPKLNRTSRTIMAAVSSSPKRPNVSTFNNLPSWDAERLVTAGHGSVGVLPHEQRRFISPYTVAFQPALSSGSRFKFHKYAP